MICPFLSVEHVEREVKYDADGKVIGEKETPRREMIECLKKECYMFDEGMSTCSILTLPSSSESLKTLIRFTRDLRDALSSMKDATDKSVVEQGKLVESMKEIQKATSDSTLSAISKLDDEFKGLARITSDVRRSVEGLTERFDGYASRLDETIRELLTKIDEGLASQGTALRDATKDSARMLEEKLDLYTEKLMEATRQSSQVLGEKLESYSEKVKGVASDSAQIIHEGLENQTTRLNDATGELSKTIADHMSALKGSITQAADESARKVEEASNAHTGRLMESFGRSSEGIVERLSEKLEEHCLRVVDAGAAGAKRMEEGLEAQGEKMVSATREISQQFLERFEAFAQQVDALGRVWKGSLQETADRLAGGMDEQRKAVDSVREGNEALLSSLRESILEKARGTDEVFKVLTTRFEEMRAEIGSSSGAQIEEQKKTNSGLQSLSSIMSGLSEKLASVSEKVGGASREMSEFIQVVKDAREEGLRRATLEDARAHNDRGVALYFRKSYTGALEEFEKAIGLDPTMAEAHSNMALCLTSMGKNEEAASSFKRALEIDPDMAEAYNNLGLLHFKKKDYEQALSLFQEAVKKREDYPNAYLNLGSAYKELAMHDKALAAWEQVLILDPGNPKAKEAIEEVRGA